MKVVVVSHARSGTHFLINTISKNFCGDWAFKNVPGTRSPRVIAKTIASPCDGDTIFKSHHSYDVFKPVVDRVLKDAKVFYVARSGLDVMTSCWHYYNDNAASVRSFPRTGSVGELMRLVSPKTRSEYGGGGEANSVQRWAAHVLGWVDAPGVTVIRYRDLAWQFDGEVAKIARALGVGAPAIPSRPTLGDHCVCPRRGVVGDYRAHVTDDDVDFFWRYGEKAMNAIGISRGNV